MCSNFSRRIMSESSAAVALLVGANTADTFSFSAAATAVSSTVFFEPPWRLLLLNRGSQSIFVRLLSGFDRRAEWREHLLLRMGLYSGLWL